MITPAISVLSAVEGLKVATPLFDPYVIPITVAILVGLFCFQQRGTAGVGAIFGPVTLVWFVVLAVLGINQILKDPAVLAAVNPWYGVDFFLANGWMGFLVLGSVFLVVTGGEALYADMGHFGPRPIRLAWFAVVLPALLLNYFGQGALLMLHPEAVANPFYRMAPRLGALPPGRSGHRGHRDRLPGGHLRRFLPHHAGHPARLQPPPGDRAHLGAGDGADLHAGGQLGADGGLHRPGARLRFLRAPGGGLRRGRDHHHGHHHPALLRRRRPSLELAAAGWRCCCAAAFWSSTLPSSAPTSSRWPTAAGSPSWWRPSCSP